MIHIILWFLHVWMHFIDSGQSVFNLRQYKRMDLPSKKKEDVQEEAGNMKSMKQSMYERGLQHGMWLEREIWRSGINRRRQTL